MGKKGRYAVESDFEDLHGNPAEDVDLDVDLSDSDNPIIRAFAGEDDDESWTPPADDDELEEDEEDGEEEDEEDDESEDDGEADDEESEEDDDDEGDDDEEEEDGDERYSKKVQKRIDRERDARRREREASDRRYRRLEKRLELRDAKDEWRDKQSDINDKLKDLREKKTEAIEEGDTAAQVDIDEQILDLKAEIKAGKERLATLQKDLENDDADTGRETPPTGQRWLEKYPEFHSNPKFRNAVLRADEQVADLGLDKNTDAYYTKIEEIVGVSFPDIVKTRKPKTTVKKKRRKKPAVGGGSKAGSSARKRTTSKRRGRVRLTKQDQANMRIFGMDPSNAEHVKAWAESKE